ncbi:glutathione S-transferase, N-terminal domain protein [Collimonas arenae]|uniref:Glutathione S-transferase, N-terminal domain protein n=1 Tax=Collimonas arenae TaxID=279058 RepID=A0A127PQ62_9BURK|nr:glutathione S-transferase family protein [Collimonas arenae]AMO99905.1 glutathione S-transferase, N-terminal domain protein [Collimonas arenae]AMP09802.1 glutathione S-transferase, N-terminal domain protein [Collimonas arenae]
MYQLYIANKNYSSWSLRPWVLLRELGIGFKEQIVPFSEGSNWDAFRGFSPTGKVPALTDGDITVWDSLGIVEYLAERHDGVWPGNPQARAWARCAAAEMHSGFGVLRERCTMNCGIRVQLEEMPAALKQDIDRIDELWQQGLERFGGPFLAGARFTAVDAFFAPVAFRAQTYGLKLSTAAQEYATRLLNLASMQQWHADALAESWREPGHEAEAKAAGILLQDLRTTIAVKK